MSAFSPLGLQLFLEGEERGQTKQRRWWSALDKNGTVFWRDLWLDSTAAPCKSPDNSNSV